MAREIKFRAWDTRGKSWLYPYPEGFHLFGETTCFDLIRDQMHERYPGESSLLLMNEVELMQYTGLKDKNGITDIYEGDIIDMSGNVRGNIYERPGSEVDRDDTDLVIQGFGTGAWIATYQEAVARGCKNAQ